MFTVYDTICEILSEQLEIPLDEITAESKLRDDLSADSLDLIDLAMTLEDEFRKEVPDEALEKMKTVGDVVAFIEEEKRTKMPKACIYAGFRHFLSNGSGLALFVRAIMARK